jgi:pantetheine-phosphate adenylyltransferase
MSCPPKIAIYPGSFDPVTRGHLNIIKRATRFVDRLIVGVAAHTGKTALFSVEERSAMIERELKKMTFLNPACEVQVCSFDNLLMDFVVEKKACMVIRGLRAVTDFEYELQLAWMNCRLNREIEMIFMMASEKNQFIASRMVKEVARLGGDLGSFVTPAVARKLLEKYGISKIEPEG